MKRKKENNKKSVVKQYSGGSPPVHKNCGPSGTQFAT